MTNNIKSILPVKSGAPTWLLDVYSLVRSEQYDLAVDILFSQVNDLLASEWFNQCDDLLKTVDLNRLGTNLTIALLSITLAAAKNLPYRVNILESARTILTSSTPDRVDLLLHGLSGRDSA